MRGRSESMEQRLSHPDDPLVVRARGTHAYNTTPNGSPRRSQADTSMHSPPSSPSTGLLSLLEREHRVNRLQAAEVQQLREEVADLRTLRAVPRDSHHDLLLHMDNHALADQEAKSRDQEAHITQLTALLASRDRRVIELEDELTTLSHKLNTALAELKAKTIEQENYLLPKAKYEPLDAAQHAFEDMTMSQLNEVGLNLANIIHTRRDELYQPAPLLTVPTERTSKRSVTPFPQMRPASARSLMTLKDSTSVAGAEAYRSLTQGMPSPTFSTFNLRSEANGGEMSDRYARKGVRFEEKDASRGGKVGAKSKDIGKARSLMSGMFRKKN